MYWRAEEFVLELSNYRGKGSRSRNKNRFNPMQRPSSNLPASVSVVALPPLSRIKRTLDKTQNSDVPTYQIFLNNYYLEVQLARESFLHKFVEKEYSNGGDRDEVWKKAGERFCKRIRVRRFDEDEIFLEITPFEDRNKLPRASHILEKEIVPRQHRVFTRNTRPDTLLQHLENAKARGFHLVVIGGTTFDPHEDFDTPDLVPYVAYLKVKERAVFDSPFLDLFGKPLYTNTFLVEHHMMQHIDSKNISKLNSSKKSHCHLLQPKFLTEELVVTDSYRRTLTYRDEQVLFNEHVLMLPSELQHTDHLALEAYGKQPLHTYPSLLKWSQIAPDIDELYETQPNSDDSPRSFYTWLQTPTGKLKFEEIWDSYAEQQDQEEEEPYEPRTAVIYNFKFRSSDDVSSKHKTRLSRKTVKGYVEIHIPHFCQPLFNAMKSKFEETDIHLIAMEEGKTVYEQLGEEKGRVYAEDHFRDETC